MVEVIKDETYKQYIPGEYERREEYGLSDIRNMDMKVVDTNTIAIKNETTGNELYSHSDGWDSGLIDGIIVSGRGYHWFRSEIYNAHPPIARDFYSGTVRKLRDNKLHISEMKNGLEGTGLIVK